MPRSLMNGRNLRNILRKTGQETRRYRAPAAARIGWMTVAAAFG